MEAVQIQKQKLAKFDIIFRILAVAATVGLAAMLSVVYIAFHPVRTIDIKGTSITTPVVKAGSYVQFDLTYCKYIAVPSAVYRQLIPLNKAQTIVPLPTTLGSASKGCGVAHIEQLITPEAAPGMYRLHGHIVYQLNSYRTATSDYITGPFTVTK